ncbi:MAG: hypothetical protein C0458_04240 [Methylobacterium sp.]|nr:hypothetical protein [Methylobacterium sp.]
MPELTDHQWRSNVETEIVLLKAGMTEVKTDIAAFRDEWRTKADEDRKAHRNARMTFPQLAGLLFGAVTMTAVLLGGLMWLINVQTSSVRSDLANQVTSAKQSAEAANAQTGLTVRGMVDGITALNNGMQTMQREQAGDRVKLGLVEQQAVANTRFIEQAQSFDAMMARHDERLRAAEQLIREIAARRPQ